MSVLTAAERVLVQLGISKAEEIDLDAIAWHLGAVVKYRLLDKQLRRLNPPRSDGVMIAPLTTLHKFFRFIVPFWFEMPGTIRERACLPYVCHDTIAWGESRGVSYARKTLSSVRKSSPHA